MLSGVYYVANTLYVWKQHQEYKGCLLPCSHQEPYCLELRNFEENIHLLKTKKK